VIRPYPILRSDETTVRLPFHLGLSQRVRPARMFDRAIAKEWVLRALRTLFPTLLVLSLATVAHAQGTMDFSGAQTLMGTFKTFAIYAGAIICFGGLIFAGIRMMSGRFQDAIPGLFGALFGAGVLGWGAGWIGAAARPAGTGSLGLL
jgi:hypothetical protein